MDGERRGWIAVGGRVLSSHPPYWEMQKKGVELCGNMSNVSLCIFTHVTVVHSEKLMLDLFAYVYK